jgi:hypothetical protein
MAGERRGTSWRKRRDPLFRGDASGGPAIPDPAADPSIVSHVLFLGGTGRATPYHSTSESGEIALRFAGSTGRVYQCSVPAAEAEDVQHISRTELLGLLRARGYGRARWKSALEVMQARRYVEENLEHLLDFSRLHGADLRSIVSRIYAPRRSS